MAENLIIRLSNNLGNQMFMYASAYALSKKMNRVLYYDHISSYKFKNHQKFALDNFRLSEKPASIKHIFIGFKGYMKRKILKKIDFIKSHKKFILEKRNFNKETFYDENIINNLYAKTVFMEGYFETEKYFFLFENEIKRQFIPQNYLKFENNEYFSKINGTESVCLCIRQNRFSEKKNKATTIDKQKSDQFVKEQIDYIKKAITYFKNKLNNPIFYLWSNNYNGLENIFSSTDVILVNNYFIKDPVEKMHCDLFLMTNCKHYAVIPSAFNWWGCWLSKSNQNICLRPKNEYFSDLHIKNKDYWPNKWINI